MVDVEKPYDNIVIYHCFINFTHFVETLYETSGALMRRRHLTFYLSNSFN